MTGPAVPDYGRTAYPLDAFRKQLDEILAGVSIEQGAHLAAPKPRPEDEQAAKIAAQLFGSKPGRVLLEYIADKTVRRPQAMPPDVKPEIGWAHAQRRSGQDDVFFFLLKLIALGKEEATPNREGSDL